MVARDALIAYLRSREEIKEYVLANAAEGVTDSWEENPRVRWQVALQSDIVPAITVRQATAGEDPAMQGDDPQPAPSFEIVCWDTDSARLLGLVAVVKTVMQEYPPGVDPAGEEVGTEYDHWRTPTLLLDVQSITFEDEDDAVDAESGENDVWVYGIRLTYKIQYQKGA